MASDRSNYTGDLHVGITSNPLIWQLQTNITIAPSSTTARHTGAAAMPTATAQPFRIHSGPPFDERLVVPGRENSNGGGGRVQPHSAPRIGGTMISFETNDETIYGVLLIGPLYIFINFLFVLHFTIILVVV